MDIFPLCIKCIVICNHFQDLSPICLHTENICILFLLFMPVSSNTIKFEEYMNEFANIYIVGVCYLFDDGYI
jgi:hypothetical protein